VLSDGSPRLEERWRERGSEGEREIVQLFNTDKLCFDRSMSDVSESKVKGYEGQLCASVDAFIFRKQRPNVTRGLTS
jgi:hypothetical protein